MEPDDRGCAWDWQAILSEHSVVAFNRLNRWATTVSATAVHVQQAAPMHDFHERGLAGVPRYESPRNHVIDMFFDFV